ncbi:MAG: hypothetical protein AAF682_23455 [Planctomycetota bacterium]
MTPHRPDHRDQNADDRLVDHVLGFGPELSVDENEEAEAYEHAVAALHLAFLSRPLDPLPAETRVRLREEAKSILDQGT